MEMTVKSELMIRLQDILSDAKMAGHYIEDGKEVFADRQIQGVRTKLVNVIQWVHKLGDNMEAAPDVAQETTQAQ